MKKVIIETSDIVSQESAACFLMRLQETIALGGSVKLTLTEGSETTEYQVVSVVGHPAADTSKVKIELK